MYRKFSLWIVIAILLTLCSCSDGITRAPSTDAATDDTTAAVSTGETNANTEIPTEPGTEVPTVGTGTAKPSNTDEDPSVYDIVLSDGKVDVGSSGAAVDNGVVTITKPGSYQLSGSSSSCEIIVRVDKAEKVELILAGVNINNPTGPAIWCDSADKLTVTVKEGTDNTLSDGTKYADPEGPNAPLFSDDDLSLRGTGSLNVIGNFNNGVSGKNDIKIEDLTLNIQATNTGIRGKTSVTIASGNVTVVAKKNEGIKSTSAEKEGKGFVEIQGGTVSVNAYDDGIQAASFVTVSGGTVTVESLNDGIQAANTITLSGGKVKVTARDDQVKAPTKNIAEGVLQS